MRTRLKSVFQFLSFVLSLTSVSCTSQYLYREDYERRALFLSFQNSSLTGFTIKSIKVENSLECVHKCLEHQECESVNFQINGNPEHLCELCNRTAIPVEQCTKRDPDFIHLTPYYEGDPVCSSIPCKNGGTCIHDCSQIPTTYRCACTLYRDGKNCENWSAIHCSGVALGLEDRRISDSQITASSIPNGYHRAHFARLHAVPGANDAGSWRGARGKGDYLQVDLLTKKMITKVATQGRPKDKFNRNQWITKYTLAYSDDGVSWTNYRGYGQTTKIFNGNSDRNTVVTNSLGDDVPIVARYIRIIVKGFVESASLRAELYGCTI